MTEWIKIEENIPFPKGVTVLLIAKYPNGYAWSDPMIGWMDEDGSFCRWHHNFPPTHYAFVLPPEE